MVRASGDRWGFLALGIAACIGLTAGALGVPPGAPPPVRAADPAASVIAKYQQRIPELMAEQNIPGLSVALVDGDRVAFVIISGGIDLSIGTVMSLSAVMTGVVVTKMGLPMPVGIVAGILTGGFMGLVNGTLIARLKLPVGQPPAVPRTLTCTENSTAPEGLS
jgi:hypothetical protein